jgi:hypothetical protein
MLYAAKGNVSIMDYACCICCTILQLQDNSGGYTSSVRATRALPATACTTASSKSSCLHVLLWLNCRNNGGSYTGSVSSYQSITSRPGSGAGTAGAAVLKQRRISSASKDSAS